MKLLIASANLHKVREFRQLLANLGEWDIYSLKDFPDYTPPEETGDTFEKNALIKARHAADSFDMWVLADDSGLVVPSLNGAPGVYSARYAGETATDIKNRLKLLNNLEGSSEKDRTAHFECCIALIKKDKYEKCVTGSCEGFITSKEKGGNGFGYDPLFIKNGYNTTFAEMDETTKLKISHRGKALSKLLLILERLKAD
ncbi:Non-canonical purine NTP pyrophosphatase [Chlamydiales bacterium SCGC AG-110-M15]|nr:Non-canonical purine NTP pyrophosphatase [Chlamydiales bacterium SCGC AG-110-M15]